MKKWLQKAKKTAQPVPRTAQEISREYTDLCSKLGHANYQIAHNQDVISAIMDRLSVVDKEGYARKQLDDQTAKLRMEQNAKEAKDPAENPNQQSGAV